MSKSLKNRKIIYLISTSILVGLLSGCTSVTDEVNEKSVQVSNKVSFTNITPEVAIKRLDNEKDIVLLDVRTKEEYDSGHIKGSILIPVDNLKAEAERKLKDKNTPIFVYCRSGNRSTTAANILAGLGYKNIYNLGGLNTWPYEVVK